jgi:hypothetical protein
MNVNSNTTAYEQNKKKILFQNCTYLSPVSFTLLINEYIRINSRIGLCRVFRLRHRVNFFVRKKPEIENLVL